MRTKLLLLLALAVCSLTFGQKKEKSEFKDVLDLDAIKSDKDYFSQAVIQFQLVEKILERYGSIYHLFPQENSKLNLVYNGITNNAEKAKFEIDNGVPTMVLFPNNIEDSNAKNKPLSKIGIDRCQFQIPMTLDDLDSGFQFNHYMFKSNNTAALEAFGIVKTNYNTESLYIVIDYIQYKDNICPGLPKIRYGVGIRSEIRISNWKNSLDIKESSLASLAANAEIKGLKVNITVKTIGITGLDSKLNIPSNTSFDVDTFADYQKIIDFIRQFDSETKDASIKLDERIGSITDTTVAGVIKTLKSKASSSQNYNKIKFKPQLIPVMNEYRTTVSQSFKPFYKSLEELEKRMEKLNRKKSKYEKYKLTENSNRLDSAMVYMYDEKISSIIDELKDIKRKKELLKRANIADIDLENYVAILEIMNGRENFQKDSISKDDYLNKKINEVANEIKNTEPTEWFVVCSADDNLSDAKDELQKILKINNNSNIIKKSGYYVTISMGYKDKNDANTALKTLKSIFPTAYIRDKSLWCKKGITEDTECLVCNN